MTKISQHISFKEATKSNTALRLNLNNIPDAYQTTNMVGVAQNVFEPLREYVGGAIKINSMFRSEEFKYVLSVAQVRSVSICDGQSDGFRRHFWS